MSAGDRRPSTAKPARIIRLLYWLQDKAIGLIEVEEGKDRDLYAVKKLPSDFGFAFEVAKHGGDTPYHVCINAMHSTCECKGFVRWGKCRHVDGLTALTKAGKI